ncbi:MAG: 5-bromo-4-chloroindolyl phosphate hydrolysis family protein, partial [Desulfovibrionaceae bacterium]|nr:5-bromo-4-chloroindolyl phosphate hydrolysis family protein [Desulfovibrionaceae bacterium]
ALRQQTELLLARVSEYLDTAATEAEDRRTVIAEIAAVSRQIAETAQTCQNRPDDPAVFRNLLRSSKWRQQLKGNGSSTQLETCLAAARALNALLEKKLQHLRPLTRPAPTPADIDGEELARIVAHEDLARQLLQKKAVLPESLAAHVEIVACATVGICQNMRNDPQDRMAGHKFLGRYLKAAHRIVDEYVRLAAKDAEQEDVAAALARSDEILARLARAFEDERAGMLRNDAVNYTAELNALEKLLTMRGH